MPFVRLLFATTILLALLVSITFAQRPQQPANPPGNGNANLFALAPDAPQPRTIHLRSGNIDTRVLPNLLDAVAHNAPPANPRTRHIIQLHDTITPDQRAALANLNVALYDYLPTNTYIADITHADRAQLAATPFIAYVGEYLNTWKIDPEVGNRNFANADRIALTANGLALLDVTLFRDAVIPLDLGGKDDQHLALDAIDALSAPLPDAHKIIIHRIEDIAGNPTITLTAPLHLVADLAAIDQVQYIEEAPDVTLRSNTNTRWIIQTNVNNNTPLYTAGIRGEGQVVGVLDGRVNSTHCSFRDTGNPIGASHRKIVAYNVSLGYDQHGTHVSGTAIGENVSPINNDTRGIAYMGRLAFALTPSFSETGVRNALQLHHNQGARAHTNSWGDDSTTAYNGLCRGIDDFCWLNQDSVVMLAATNLGSLRNPENAKNLVAVGASGGSGSQTSHCSGGAGPTSDGRRKPEVYAPGCNTTSSSGSGGTACSTATLSGTSMASPAVAGMGLLMRQYYTDGFYPTGSSVPGNAFTPTGALIKATLINSCVDMTGVAGYPSNTEGWGRLLADEALAIGAEARRMIVKDIRNNQAGSLSTGQSVDHPFTVSSNAHKLKVTLVWTEPAATSGAAIAYINNLDLEVIGPSGTYLGNVFSGGVSITGGSADFRNNVEQVHLNTPVAGSWIARVKGTAVNQSLQGYSLVISGAVGEGPPPPSNDLCSAAPIIAAGNHAFTNVNATTDGPNEPGLCNFGGYSHLENDVWFRFLAPCDGTATISLCGANFNSKLAVYNTCPTGSGEAIACNDDFCGSASEVSFPVSTNFLYRIRIGGFNGATGSGTMVITCEEDSPDCPADVAPPGGDGSVGVPDLLAIINAWGACGGCPEDVAPEGGDGSVGVPDLLAIINGWGACPP